MSNIFTNNNIRSSPTEILINDKDNINSTSFIKQFPSFNNLPIERSDNPSPTPIRRAQLDALRLSIMADGPNRVMLTIADNKK